MTGTAHEQQQGEQHAGEWAVKALERINSLGLVPAPDIYELWFRFFQGDPDIVAAVEAHDGPFSERACKEIYQRCLEESPQGKAVRRVSGEVQRAISELAGMLGSVKDATAEYGESLNEATDKIKTITTMDELEMVVASIVKDTKKMVEKNQTLEIQLVNSSKQVTELRQELDSISKEVLTDTLTGLGNRKAFDKKIVAAIEEMTELGAPLTLILLDIDHFKKFNDSVGHQIGDQVLRLVARTLTDNVKGRDFAARYGGEEFAIILPETPMAGGLRVAESLRKNVENKEIVNKGTGENLGRITLSIGVGEYIPGEKVAAWIARTDAALYEAKKGGRNTVREAAKK